VTLVLAATPAELAWAKDAAAIGVGPVEAAIATTRALVERRPAAVLHVGLAGARRAAGLPIGTLVLGTSSRYCDLVAALPRLEREVAPDEGLLVRARAALPEAVAAPIGTSAAVGGSSGADIEAMEGFAVLRACALLGVPALELRVVSNEIEEQDRSRWDFAGALAVLAAAGPRLLSALDER
jgi:nucleoside phosphorylase